MLIFHEAFKNYSIQIENGQKYIQNKIHNTVKYSSLDIEEAHI